jgi:hypothetical protein
MIFAALIPTQAHRALRHGVPSAEPFTFPNVFLSAAVVRHMEELDAGAEDEDRVRRRDDIPAAIANLGVIIGGPAVRAPANDNRAKSEPEAIGNSGNHPQPKLRSRNPSHQSKIKDFIGITKSYKNEPADNLPSPRALAR